MEVNSSVILTFEISKPPVCRLANPESIGEPNDRRPDLSVAANRAFPSSFKPTGFEKPRAPENLWALAPARRTVLKFYHLQIY